ncbi:NAD(P)H-hydrate dehydratase [Siminovitchia sp. FSL W7-1587]|uniref:NAD(P)H-hydrate dehydratase n=1 Tax=Siminovitchia sp. FSL W7-1587 TaxID=2954699 RepID=UPI0030CBBCD1
MFVAGRREMQLIDQYAIENLGLPGAVLMENAGAKVAEEVSSHFSDKKTKVIILAGAGNNGGDGFVVARRLFDMGYAPCIWVLVDPSRIKGDARIHYNVFVNRGLPIFYLEKHSIAELQNMIKQADVIVDAILGTGAKGAVREPFDQVISLINEQASEKWILSIDIPSGVNSDNGRVEGIAVKATKTITFVCPKKGFFLREGPAYVGEWKAVDISIPPLIAETLKLEMPKVITRSLAAHSLPARPQTGHKGTFGHVVVIGGSHSYIGAPIFTAKAALHSGAGLVTAAVPESVYPLTAAQLPEALFYPLASENGHFSAKAIEELALKLDEYDVAAIGPGMGRFQGGEQWLAALMDKFREQPIIIDADALTLLRDHLHLMTSYPGQVIFTPHPGEMARLLHTSIKEVETNRLEVAKSFAQEHRLYLLLKGHRSIIATPAGDLYINPYGHDALGKGGSGDVLTGLIASFLAQGAPPLEALISASFLHARTAETKTDTLSHYGVTPLDLIAGIKELLNDMVKLR